MISGFGWLLLSVTMLVGALFLFKFSLSMRKNRKLLELAIENMKPSMKELDKKNKELLEMLKQEMEKEG